MPIAFFVSLFSWLLAWFEQLYLRFTQLPHSSFSLALATDLTRTKAQLVVENAFLRQQLLILQRQVKKPRLTHTERFSLLLLASRLQNWKHLLLILQPDTLLRWHRQGFKLFWRIKSRARRGCPPLAQDLVALIQQMASENPLWGAERLHGELLKLALHVAKDTIQTYLHRLRPPRSPAPAWNTFWKNHAQDVWACDLLPVIDLFFRQVFVFFIIEVGSRRVVHFGVTRHPTDAWVAQQLREATPYAAAPRFLIRDNDRKYGAQFTRVAESSQIEVLRTPYRASRANAVCERFLGSVRRECLDQLLIMSEGQLYRMIKEYLAYFNGARPHQGIEQRVQRGLQPSMSQSARGRSSPFQC